jgi:broad specificity phosphatase PhoE
MTPVLLIPAAPTPWDTEDRLGGNPMLPLTTDGEIALRKTLEAATDPVTAIYTCESNQACDQAAKLAARRFGVRVYHSDPLEPVSMGLWQGLTRDELRRRFPTVFPEWEDNPLNVNPPEGEALIDAAARYPHGLRKILRKNRGHAIALVLRPLSLQISAGLLRGQDLPTLVRHLHEIPSLVRIDVPDDLPAE